jgi:hypothetical protein
MPTICKLLIVVAIRSGTPEVNIHPFTTRSTTPRHVHVFWESEWEVTLGIITNVSVTSKWQLIQERLVKGHKDKKKKKNNKDDVREEKRQLDGEGGEGLGRVNDIRIDDNNYKAGWGYLGEGMPHRQVALPLLLSNGSGAVSDKIFSISQLCQIMESPGTSQGDNGQPHNKMEELTLGAMSHLPTAVMYMMDLSGGAGDKCSSVEDQLVLRTIPSQALDRRGVEG